MAKTVKQKNFEESMTRLENIIDSLEDGECGLEESMKLFEEGVGIISGCEKQLSAARQKITLLSDTEKENLDD